MLAVALRVGLCVAVAALASGAGADAADKPRPFAPRDLDGIWTSLSLTSLERPKGLTALEVTETEARAFEAANDGTPPIPGDDVGHKSSEWWDLGVKLARIDGKPRSSWLIDPPDGRLPYSDAGRRRLMAQMKSSADGPEVRPATERCLAGAAGASTPPLLNTPYNSNLQIVQTPDYVVILTEMTRDARIVPLKDARRPPGPIWSGSSVGHWEGDTLVVETSGFHPGEEWRAPIPLYISTEAKVTERFTPISPDEIRYGFTVEDPQVFTRAWRGELPLRRATKPMYEFACHEGNYSLPGVLAGAREGEKTAASATAP